MQSLKKKKIPYALKFRCSVVFIISFNCLVQCKLKETYEHN